MQYRHGVGHAPAKLALRSEGLYQSKAFAPMQYRHGIGHAPANFAFAADTKRKTSVPLFFASTGGLRLPSSMPILHQSLQFIDCYSPSLRRFSQVSGSDCSLTDLLYIIASSYWFLQFFSSQVFASIGLRLPLFKAYRVNIAPYYLFTLKKLFITENCTTFVCLFDLFSPRLSILKDT